MKSFGKMFRRSTEINVVLLLKRSSFKDTHCPGLATEQTTIMQQFN